MATYREALSDIDDELRFQLLGAMLDDSEKDINYDIFDEEYISMNHFLGSIMYWSNTPQGFDYWSEKAANYKE